MNPAAADTADTPHARAVLALCDSLAAAGHTVISATTDPHAEPQVFAQAPDGAFAFYFTRPDAPPPDAATLERYRALAARHGARCVTL